MPFIMNECWVRLINKIVINQVISYWPSYRSEVCCVGLINNIIILKISDSREKTLTCVRSDKSGSFRPYFVFSFRSIVRQIVN